jgi:acyl-CoA thioesterase-1
MNGLVLHFANGNSLFVGFLVTAVACILSSPRRHAVVRSALRILNLVGGILVVLSATPFPPWAYVIWALAFSLCLVAAEWPRERKPGWRPVAVGLLLLVSTILSALEYPYHRRPSLPLPKDKPIVVIGDSISAGVQSRENPWPAVLARMTGLSVTNLALGGNTAGGALDEARSLREADVSVLLEIGGNDILGDTSAGQFEKDLEALLDEVCRPGRVVAMFELPLPPFYNAFGRIQRRQAESHRVILIPKPVMTTVFGAPGATVDSLHLSQAGHDKMASLVKAMIP